MDEIEQAAGHLGRNLSTLRRTRGLTQDALAKAAGLPRSTIANLESGEGNPSLTVLMKISGALGAPIDELVASPRARVRRWASAEMPARAVGHGVSLRPLAPESAPDEQHDLMTLEPAAAMRGTPHLPGTREYFTCLEGRVVIGVAGDRYELEPGDVLAFPGNLPHAYQNPDAARPARGVSIVILAKAGL